MSKKNKTAPVAESATTTEAANAALVAPVAPDAAAKAAEAKAKADAERAAAREAAKAAKEAARVAAAAARESALARAHAEVRRRTDAEAARRSCLCGCGTQTPRAFFVPGHDAKLVSALLAAEAAPVAA